MRVFVTGPTGSGKSTFAKVVATATALPLYALDDLHWVKCAGGDRRRAPDVRLALLDPIVQQRCWIVEGVQFKWADPALDHADKIIVLNIPQWRTTIRILRRFVGRHWVGERSHRATWAALRQELRWSSDYYHHERTQLFDKLVPYRDKVIEIDSRRAQLRALAELQVPAERQEAGCLG